MRKDESESLTDARKLGKKILKICTFKVRPERRGVKLGELLLKQVLWFAQTNNYDLTYVTTFPNQGTLIDLIEYYGFEQTYTKDNGELVYEKVLSRVPLSAPGDQSLFVAARKAYPRFYAGDGARAYAIPIKERFHEILFPELADRRQTDLFEHGAFAGPKAPGNTIRKVYLCRAQARVEQPGAILFFYKGKSECPPSQAITTVGIFENIAFANSTEELWRLAGGRSVYSDLQLRSFNASTQRPVKVMNFLLVGHIAPPIGLPDLLQLGVFVGHPPQSIFGLDKDKLHSILKRIKNFGFKLLP